MKERGPKFIVPRLSASIGIIWVVSCWSDWIMGSLITYLWQCFIIISQDMKKYIGRSNLFLPSFKESWNRKSLRPSYGCALWFIKVPNTFCFQRQEIPHIKYLKAGSGCWLWAWRLRTNIASRQWGKKKRVLSEIEGVQFSFWHWRCKWI